MKIEPIYLRWENTTPPHRKFYEVEVELSLFYPKTLIRRWGRIGTRRPKCIRTVMTDSDELMRRVELVARRRERHGYHTVREVLTSVTSASAA